MALKIRLRPAASIKVRANPSLGVGTFVASFNGRTGAVSPVTGDYTASNITNAAAGTISSTNVQDAINELDTEKVGTTRQVIAGAGLSGGGSLASDVTLSVDDMAGGTIKGRKFGDSTGEPADLTREIVHASDYASINAAVTAISTTPKTLVVSEAETLTASLTIPSTLRLEILKGGSIVKASTYTLTINGPFEAGLYEVFSGFSAGNVTFGNVLGGVVYPEWWGAVGDGSTDDSTACQCAINSLTYYGKVKFAPKTYQLGTRLLVSASYIGIEGSGKYYTRLQMAAGSTSAIRFAGTYAATIANVRISDLAIIRSGAGTGGVGVDFFRCSNPHIHDVHVADYLVGVQLERSTNTVAERVLSTFSTGSTDNFIGFYLNCSIPQTFTVTIATPGVITLNDHGLIADSPVVLSTSGALPTGLAANTTYYVVGSSITTHTFQLSATAGGAAINTSGSQSGTHKIVLGGAGGNASSIFRACWVDAGGHGGAGHTGFYAIGAYVADLIFDACETASTHSGFVLDGQYAFTAGNEDVQLLNCRSDFFSSAGFSFQNMTGEAMVSVVGGWINPKSTLATSYGVYINASRGVSVDNLQIYANANNAGYSQGIFVYNSQNVTLDGCLLTNQEYGIVLDSTSYATLTGNRIWSSSSFSSTTHLTMGGCTGVALIGNILDGYASTGISIDNASANTIVYANTLNATNISSPLTDLSSSTKYGKNVGFSGAYPVDGPSTNNDEYVPQWNGANNPVLKNGFPVSTLGKAIANASSKTANGVILGNGTSEPAVTAAMTDGQLLVGQTSSAPLPKTISGDVTVAASGAVTIATGWTTYAPNISGTGLTTTTTNAAKYLQMGKIVFVVLDITISSATAGSGFLTIDLPVTAAAANQGTFHGSEIFSTGDSIKGYLSNTTTLAVNRYNSATLIVTGYQVALSGFYVAA